MATQWTCCGHVRYQVVVASLCGVSSRDPRRFEGRPCRITSRNAAERARWRFWFFRTLARQGTGGADLNLGDLQYDNASNLSLWKRQAGTAAETWTATHDAWNRLTDVSVGSSPRLRQAHNALHWRTYRFGDLKATPGGAPAATPDGKIDQARFMHYGADWRLLEERVDDDFILKDWNTGAYVASSIDRTQQHVWGLRYIDDAVLHRIDSNKDGDYTDAGDGTWYHLTDAQFSSVCLVDPAGTVAERVSYSAYGLARHHWKGDVDGDGAVTVTGGTSDLGLVTAASGSSIGGAGYRAEYDLDRDGDVDAADQSLVGSAAAALPAGQLSPVSASGPDSQAGWDGYLYSAETGLYAVRFRTYEPALGRWVERDPAGYRQGVTLFVGLSSNPQSQVDPFGLKATTIRYTTFIPQDYITLLDKVYEGDGAPRNVDFDRNVFRTRQTLKVDLDSVPCDRDPSTLLSHEPETGISKRFGKDWTGFYTGGERIRLGAGREEWVREAIDRADPKASMKASISSVSYARSPCGDCCVTGATIKMIGEAYNPVGPVITAAIDYNFTLVFSRPDCCSPGTWTFNGTHDGFPSHLLFIEGMGGRADGLVYWYDASSQDPMYLIGSSDVSVGPHSVQSFKEPKGCVHGLLH